MINAPFIINNYITTINITFFVIGGTVGIIMTILTKLGTSLIDDYFKKTEAMWKRKNRLADQIMEICTEGSSVAFNAMPGNQRHIQHLANLIEGIDKSVADDLRKYLGLWALCAIRQTPGPYLNKNPTSDDIEFCTNIQRQATVLENNILSRIRKWR